MHNPKYFLQLMRPLHERPWLMAPVVLLMVGLHLCATPAWSAGLPDDEGAQRALAVELLAATDRARGGGLPGIQWSATVATVENGREQYQELTVEARGPDSLVTFEAPARIRGQRLLMRGRNLWFVRPDVRRPVPISPRQRLMGAAATGDVAATNYADDYEAVDLWQDACKESQCYVLDLHAAHTDVTYARILYWVDQRTRLGVRAEFYAQSGRHFRSAEFEYNNQISFQDTDVPFVSRMRIVDELTGDVTTLSYRDPEAVSIPARRFDPQNLVR